MMPLTTTILPPDVLWFYSLIFKSYIVAKIAVLWSRATCRCLSNHCYVSFCNDNQESLMASTWNARPVTGKHAARLLNTSSHPWESLHLYSQLCTTPPTHPDVTSVSAEWCCIHDDRYFCHSCWPNATASRLFFLRSLGLCKFGLLSFGGREGQVDFESNSPGCGLH